MTSPTNSIEVEVEWTIDDNAMVRGPLYHDGNLASLRIDHQFAEVVIDVVGGGQSCFRFDEAEFGSIGFVGNAIIADVFAFQIHKSDDPGPELSEAIYVLNGGMIPLGDFVSEGRFMSGHHEDLLVQFTCSYGGPFSIRCRTMTVTRRGY